MLTALLAAAAMPAAPACPIERAVYRLHGAPQFTAGFARQDRRDSAASDLVLWLNTPKRTYWFAFGSPNGYGGTYLAPEIDPRLSVRLSDEEERDAAGKMGAQEPLGIAFDAFAADLGAFGAPPQSSDKAPSLLFARGLGPALWYSPTALAGGDRAAQEESMPIGLFKAAGCAGPPKEAKPGK
ncbi:MAG: hypothetical protein ACXW27_12250 [Allosphingosinicella sp.]